MHSYHLLLVLPLVLAAPLPEFAGIGPWEGEFFGRDPGKVRASAYNPHGLTPLPYGPSAYYGAPPGPYPYGPMPPPQGPYSPYGLETTPDKYHFVPADDVAGGGDFMQPPPPPPPPIDLMNASKEELAAALPPPKRKDTPKPAPEPKGPAETEGCPDEDETREEKQPRPFDFMGSRWGIAGQGQIIDAARGDHKYPHGVNRDERRHRWGVELAPAEKEAIKVRKQEEEEKKKEEEEGPKQVMPEVEVEHAGDPEHPMRYKVNVGGIKTGPGDETGPSNFHVFTNEGTNTLSSNDMSPETRKYIIEKMLPKLGGRRKKGGNASSVFSVFGDD